MGVGRHLRRAALLGAFACASPAALTLAPAARADGLLAPSGSLVYSWHGDPARGCARIGVCGIQGTLIVTPQAPSFFLSGGHGAPSSLEISGTATVRVRRSDPGSVGDCVDSDVWPTEGSGALTVSWRRDGHARAVVPGFGGPSSGRCAGPRPGDLGAVLSGRRHPGHGPSFSFIGSRVFRAGPYSGTLVSTLTFGPFSGTGFSSSGSSSASSPGRPPRLVLFERVQLQIRMITLPGILTARFAGEPDAYCAALDACGTAGTLSLASAAAHTTVTLDAQRRVGHRVSRARALADFRSGRLDLGLGGFGATLRESVSETLTRSGASPCAEGPILQSPAATFLGSPFDPSQREPVIAVIVASSAGSLSLRTHCQGPTGTDVFGANDVLARGSIALSALLRSHSTVVVHAQGAFSGMGYVGSRSGSLTFRLSLVKVLAGSIRAPA